MSSEERHARMVEFVDPVDGTRWDVDVDFLTSNWSCVWNAGCRGVAGDDPEAPRYGCCTLGAELLDEDEARRITALAATLDGSQFANAGAVGGVVADDGRRTRVVDGRCVFFNPWDFAGGAGCALHIGADADGESPTDWKPSVCWQLPLKVERPEPGRATLRRWTRTDWGSGHPEMDWWCTEPDAEDGSGDGVAFVGTDPVTVTMAEEIEALVGPDVAVEIRTRLGR